MNQQSFNIASQNEPGSPATFSLAFTPEFRIFPFADGGFQDAIARAEEFTREALANGDDQTEVFIVGAFNETGFDADFEDGEDFDAVKEFRRFARGFSTTAQFADFDRVKFFCFSSFGSNAPLSTSFMQAFTFIHHAQNSNVANFGFENFFNNPPFQENFGFAFSFKSFIFCFATQGSR